MSAPVPDRAARRPPAARLRARLGEPPPGPFRPDFWRSPLRGPWLTSFLGTLLGPLILVIAATGLISHDAYYPELGNNATISPAHDIGVLIHLPPSGPSWSYALTQGLHVTIGLITIPVLLAKLWSVIPRLFAWPAVRSMAQALERGSLLLLVGGALFEFATGRSQHPELLPVALRLRSCPLLRRLGVLRSVHGSRCGEAAGRHPGVSRARLAAAAARRSDAHATRAAGAGRPRAGRPGAGDAQPPRTPRSRRRRVADIAAPQRRRDGRRSAAAFGAARPAWTRVRAWPERLSGQQNRRSGRGHDGADGACVAASRRRRFAVRVADARAAAGDASAHP